MTISNKTSADLLRIWSELVNKWGGRFIEGQESPFSGVALFNSSGLGGYGASFSALPVIVLSNVTETDIKTKFENLQGELGRGVADFLNRHIPGEVIEQVSLVFISGDRDRRPAFIRNIYNRSGIGIRFYGRKDLESLCKSYDDLFDRFFSNQAEQINQLKAEVSAKGTRIIGLESELTTYRNDYKNLVELNQRVRKADAWRKLISMTLHRAHSFLGGILFQIDNMRVSPPETWTIQHLNDIEETVKGLTTRLNELEDRDIRAPILGEIEVCELLPWLKELAKNTKATYRKSQKKAIVGSVLISRKQLEDALRELLYNAYLWTKELEKPSVWLIVKELTRADGNRFLEITVKDNGPGVKPDLKEAIFLPLVSFRIEGTGRGLSMVAKVVQEMKGDVVENGKFGEGAQFTIQLPILEDR